MLDAFEQPRLIRQIGARLTDFQGSLLVGGDLRGSETSGRLEQFVADFSDQSQRCGDGDIGDQMRRVFETQPVFDQAGRARLAQDFLKDGLDRFVPEPLAKLCQQTRFWQLGIQ